ncbi:hypothetical protein B0H16DRAFT_1719237 [Mycena metata]|uniref:Uncharacterized protein n=1 Tax=Mycena metata TaxID=1033252 RepID=A0AAD7JCU8_9AGAR|nr:hypothetical protein B0H16DRAFT_1719237 [Mycena metata]
MEVEPGRVAAELDEQTQGASSNGGCSSLLVPVCAASRDGRPPDDRLAMMVELVLGESAAVPWRWTWMCVVFAREKVARARRVQIPVAPDACDESLGWSSRYCRRPRWAYCGRVVVLLGRRRARALAVERKEEHDDDQRTQQDRPQLKRGEEQSFVLAQEGDGNPACEGHGARR